MFRYGDHHIALTRISHVSENNCQQITAIQNNLKNIESLLTIVIENQSKNQRQVTTKKPNVTVTDELDGRNNFKNTESFLTTSTDNQSKNKEELPLHLGQARAADNSEGQNNLNNIKTLLTSVFENQGKDKPHVSPNREHTISTDKIEETSLSVEQEDLKHGVCGTKNPHLSEKDKKLGNIATDHQNPLSRSAIYPKTKVKRLPIQGFKISWQVMFPFVFSFNVIEVFICIITV